METKQLFFNTSVIWTEKSTGVMISPNAFEPIEVATPIEYPNGEKGKWSPENLFLGAISSCFMTTFLSLAKRKNLTFVKFQCHSGAVVEKIDGKLEITEVKVFPELRLMDEEDRELAEQVLELTEKNCLIGNAVKSEILFYHLISVQQELAMA